jgi:MoaA/NifB/PqqE/SkfB family radical SAM enzyme
VKTRETTEKDMHLPEGKTCDDCKYFKRCIWICGATSEDTACDWSPSMFVEKPTVNEEAHHD